MKKIRFLLLLAVVIVASCTKEEPLNTIPPKGGFVYVDYKPMPKAVIPDESIEFK